MNSSLLTEIASCETSLSKSEQRVASWLLGNARRAVDLSISDVAEAAEVSEPTVIRFARSMGLSGFRELRTQLISALQKPESYVHEGVSADDPVADAANKVLESSIQALVELRESLPRMPFEPAIDALSNARQITFVGLGASGIVAEDGSHKFFRLGVPCSTAIDAQTILQKAAIAQSGDAFVAVSHTGNWPELVTGMRMAKTRGALVIAVTRSHTELADLANFTFNCDTAEDTNVFTPMSSRLAQLTLLDALQVALAVKLGSAAEANLALTKSALINHRDQVDNA